MPIKDDLHAIRILLGVLFKRAVELAQLDEVDHDAEPDHFEMSLSHFLLESGLEDYSDLLFRTGSHTICSAMICHQLTSVQLNVKRQDDQSSDIMITVKEADSPDGSNHFKSTGMTILRAKVTKRDTVSGDALMQASNITILHADRPPVRGQDAIRVTSLCEKDRVSGLPFFETEKLPLDIKTVHQFLHMVRYAQDVASGDLHWVQEPRL